MNLFGKKVSADQILQAVIIGSILWAAAELHHLSINVPVLNAKVTAWHEANEKSFLAVATNDKEQNSCIAKLKSYHAQSLFMGSHTNP